MIALVNGGTHSEANMQVACDWCHKGKTRQDVAAKAKSASIRMHHAGIKRDKPKILSRGFGPHTSNSRDIYADLQEVADDDRA